MTTFNELFDDLHRFAIGFSPTIRALNNFRYDTSSYPHYDLEEVSENQYRLTLAVAGFGESEIDVSQEENRLTIEGKKKEEESKQILYRGIAGRSFKRSFYLEQHVNVVSASLTNGLLTIDLTREIPEARKARLIPIDTTKILPKLEPELIAKSE
jgi:molecular chaperone IbpA